MKDQRDTADPRWHACSRLASISLAVTLSLLGCGGYERPRLPGGADDWTFGDEGIVPDDDGAVVFAAVGDMGKANVPQAVVANGVRRACADRCDFVVLLGDNVYESGVADADDERALACMIGKYGIGRVYSVLGNHDYDPVEPTMARARRELGWIRRDERASDGVGAHGDHHFYRFQAGPVRLVALDTNLLVRGVFDEDAYGRLARWLGPLHRDDDEWLIVLGHHPYVSNGSHHSAGVFLDAGLSLWPGRFFHDVMARHVMGRADLYLAGHDHNLQFIPNVDDGRTAQVVSGSGSKCNPPPATRDFDEALEHYGYGFAVVEASAGELTVGFHDAWGAPLWQMRRTRVADWRATGRVPRASERTSRCDEDRARMVEASVTPCRPNLP